MKMSNWIFVSIILGIIIVGFIIVAILAYKRSKLIQEVRNICNVRRVDIFELIDTLNTKWGSKYVDINELSYEELRKIIKAYGIHKNRVNVSGGSNYGE